LAEIFAFNIKGYVCVAWFGFALGNFERVVGVTHKDLWLALVRWKSVIGARDGCDSEKFIFMLMKKDTHSVFVIFTLTH